MSDEKRLLAFVVSEEADQIFLHVDKEGVNTLISELERIRKNLKRGEVAHAHLFSAEWGDGELSLSDRVVRELVSRYIMSRCTVGLTNGPKNTHSIEHRL